MTQDNKEVSQDTQNLTFKYETSNPVRNFVVIACAAVGVATFTNVVNAIITKKL